MTDQQVMPELDQQVMPELDRQIFTALDQQVKTALDRLIDYPEISEYIKNFNGKDGFMYTIETDPQRKALKDDMERVLDDGNHSMASWGIMMRTIQAVLKQDTNGQ